LTPERPARRPELTVVRHERVEVTQDTNRPDPPDAPAREETAVAAQTGRLSPAEAKIDEAAPQDDGPLAEGLARIRATAQQRQHRPAPDDERPLAQGLARIRAAAQQRQARPALDATAASPANAAQEQPLSAEETERVRQQTERLKRIAEKFNAAKAASQTQPEEEEAQPS
jgi:hypothetical protein